MIFVQISTKIIVFAISFSNCNRVLFVSKRYYFSQMFYIMAEFWITELRGLEEMLFR